VIKGLKEIIYNKKVIIIKKMKKINKFYLYKMIMGGMNSEIVREDSWRVLDSDEVSFKVEGVMMGGGDEDCVYMMSEDRLDDVVGVYDDNNNNKLDVYWHEVNRIGEEYFV